MDMRPVAHGSSGSREGRARRICQVFNARRIGELLEQVDLGAQVVAVEPVDIPEDIAVPRRDSALSAWVNVIHGCNERCTYCVVPNTRGAEQSRAPDAIRARRRGLCSCGSWYSAGRPARAAGLQSSLGVSWDLSPRRTLRPHCAAVPDMQVTAHCSAHAFRVVSDPAAARPAGLVSQRG